jgi:hypothetical protein
LKIQTAYPNQRVQACLLKQNDEVQKEIPSGNLLRAERDFFTSICNANLVFIL